MDYSFQLYSARNAAPLEASLRMLAGLGYRQVEGHAGLYADPAALAGMLREYGLIMPTAHVGLSQLEDVPATIAVARALGIRCLFCPAIAKEERSGDEAHWVALGRRLARLGEAYRREGLGFGWHNHDFEFRPLPDGRLPMDILLDVAPLNDWELDVAWLVRAGQDPAGWIEKHGQRINAVHVKDLAAPGDAADEGGWADVGHGTMGWADLMAAIRAGSNAQYFIMEHDNPTDVERFARRSIAFLKDLAPERSAPPTL
jgi:sugar phosphate isomerase/epimerase